MPTPHDKLLVRFKAEVYDKASDIDPEDEHDWTSLAFGFGLGAGLSARDAEEFAFITATPQRLAAAIGRINSES